MDNFLSPVPHLLSSNVAPSDEEISLIYQAMVVVKEGYEMQKGAIFLKKHKSILSPLRRVPPEVLGHIFLMAVDPNDTFPSFSQVSRLWRDVSLSTPALWTIIKININSLNAGKSYASVVDLRLQRSRNLPLDVFIGVYNGENVGNPAILSIIAHSDRWENVAIHATACFLPCLQRIKGRLSALLKLEVNIPRISDSESQCQVYNMFEEAPLLRSVHISAPRLKFSLPWSQLTKYLNEQGDTHVDNHNILSELDAIKHLRIVWNATPVLRHSRTLQNVEVLHVDFKKAPNRSFFHNLILPNLKVLKISNDYGAGGPIPRLTSLIKNSGSPFLHTLSLQNIEYFKPGQLITLLKLTIGLINLNIHLPPCEDLIGLANTQIVPKLRALNLIASSIRGSEQFIKRISRSRCDIPKFAYQSHPTASENICIDTMSPGLKSFSITFGHEYTRNKEREIEMLEGYWPFATLDPNVHSFVQDLLQWHQWLRDAMPDNAVNSCLWSKVTPAQKTHQISVLKRLFASMELDKIKDVSYLYISGLHITLNKFVNLPPVLIPGNWAFNFQQRGQKILAEWDTLLVKDLSNRHWVFIGDRSVSYIPKHDRGKSLHSDPKQHIYGLEYPKPKVDIPLKIAECAIKFSVI